MGAAALWQVRTRRQRRQWSRSDRWVWRILWIHLIEDCVAYCNPTSGLHIAHVLIISSSSASLLHLSLKHPDVCVLVLDQFNNTNGTETSQEELYHLVIIPPLVVYTSEWSCMLCFSCSWKWGGGGPTIVDTILSIHYCWWCDGVHIRPLPQGRPVDLLPAGGSCRGSPGSAAALLLQEKFPGCLLEKRPQVNITKCLDISIVQMQCFII